MGLGKRIPSLSALGFDGELLSQSREKYMKETVLFVFFIFRSDRTLELQNTKQLCAVVISYCC